MASLARKIAKKLGAKSPQSSTAIKNTDHGMVTRRINPATGEMQDYHYTKGWR